MPMMNSFLRVLLLLGLLCWQRRVVEAQQEQLNAARNRWNTTTQGITSNNYAYTYQETRNKVADADRIIQIQNGVVTSADAAIISSGVEPGDPADYPNVEGMFGIIQDAIIDDDSTVIQARYNQEYGLPTNISILYGDNNQESLEIQIRWLTLYSVIQLELDRNRNKWNDLELVDYDYSLQISCFCSPDYTSPKMIEVRDSEIVFVAELETGEEATFTDHGTAEGLFDAIQVAIDNSYSTIDVEYNECLGYPMEVSTNPSTQMADAGTSTEIRDLVPQQDITTICTARDPPNRGLAAPVSLPTSSPTAAPTIDLDAKQADLDVARKRWTTATATETIASNNYIFSYEETRNGVSDEDRIIEVRNDTVTSAEAEFGRGDDEPGDLADYPTVEDMFGSIQDAIDDDSQVIQIQYDQEYGYPTNILIRRKNNREMLKAKIGWMTLYSILQNELDGYKERWNDLEISDYRYGIHVSCFCMPDYVSPKTIEVRGDEIDSVTVTETGDASEITNYDTVLDAFDDIQNALNRFYSIIEVEYNETYGYPKVVSLNPSTGMADAGISVEISDLVVVAI
jgi:hypothetical protein